ncbi:MAG: nucleotidyltransferase family protein, partial [Acidobacteria bacterium]|nr:nucleotidyltransferase family protein [Acidobacteriota bacterium]
SQGYRSDVDARTVAEAAEGKIPGQYQFTHDVRQCIVELHTEGTLRYFPTPLDLGGLGRRLEPVQLGGREVLTFSAEDALPILCVHGSKHFWERLSWIADIAELAQIPQGVDWEAAARRARELGAERMLFLGLHLANDLLAAPLPETILQRARSDRVVCKLGEQVHRQFWSETRDLPGLAQRALFRLRMRGNVWEGVRYLLRLATAPTEEDWSDAGLAGRFSPLYVVLRPFRLLRKYGLGLKRGPATDLARYVPTPPWIVERMLALAEVGPDDVVYDLGCGDGRIVVMAAKRFGARGVGVDIDPRRIAEAQAHARAEGVEHRVKFMEQDAKAADLSEATVVTLYLRLLGNARLGQQLRAQLRPGARVVSRDGQIPGWPAEKREQLREESGDAATLYLWRIGDTPLAGSEPKEMASRAKTAPG